MKLVASDGMLLSQKAAAGRQETTCLAGLRRPAREKMFLVEAGSYVRRTANHRDDPILCELCGSVTEAFHDQQVRVDLFGHSAEVMKWKNDRLGRHLRGSGSARFCSTHNQRNSGSQYRSAFRVSGEAAKWRSVLETGDSCSEFSALDVIARDVALALSSPRIGERMIGERMTLLAEAERRRLDFVERLWRAFSNADVHQPDGLSEISRIEFTLFHPGDEKVFGRVSEGLYRFSAGPGLYDKCRKLFPRRSLISKYLSFASDTGITTRSGTAEGEFFLPDWMRHTFDKNPGMGAYADFVNEVAQEHRECRELVLWVPSVRGWIIFESMKNKSWVELSGDPYRPMARSQSVTVVFEQMERWRWALNALWGRARPLYDSSLGTYVLPHGVDVARFQ